MEKEYSVNEQIEASDISLVFQDGRVESIQLTEALKIGEEHGLDIVEVSKGDKIGVPVCKLLDYGKMMYEKNKKKGKTKVQHVKEIKYSFNIDPHDLGTKHNKIMKFLTKQYIVKYTMEVSGRQKNMLDKAKKDYNKNIEDFRLFASWSEPKTSHGRTIAISTTLKPLKAKT